MLRLKINNQSQSRAVIVAGELGYYISRQNTCTYINTCTQIKKKKKLPLGLSTRIFWNSLGEARCILNHVDYKLRNKSRLYKLLCKWLVKIN